jgi:hypothetical protein
MVVNGRRRILQGTDIPDPQNELSEGELLRKWILFRDVVEMVDKSVDFNAFLLQLERKKRICVFSSKVTPMVPNCK